MPNANSPQPGWYPDPENAAVHRWWDGAQWTEQRKAPASGPPPPAPVSAGVAAKPAGRVRRQYKVLTQKDRFFGGKFDPEKLESAINSYAAEGWRVVVSATAQIPSLTGSREELIIVLEREG